ncbi:MAG TPA: DMT family transporter [Candidatus Kapabacteria bacterium]|nr:DMT family transporter [Candidatus Kapabacteria bacterium]
MTKPLEKQPPDTQRRAESILLGITLIWGATFVIVKGAVAQIDPSAFLAIRFTIAALLCIAIFRKHLLPVNRAIIIDGIVLGFLFYVGFLLQTTGLKYTSASNSGFITGTVAVFTPIIQVALERRLPKWNHTTGILIVMIGLFLLSGRELGIWNEGDLMTLGCAVAFSFYIVWLDIVSQRRDFRQLTVMQLLCVAIFSFCAIPFMSSGSIVLTGSLVFALFYTAIMATVVTAPLQTKYQRFTTPSKAAIIYTAEPVFSAIFAYYILHETLEKTQWIGAGMIIAGVLVSELAGKRQEA